jgi:hypothetical protein
VKASRYPFTPEKCGGYGHRHALVPIDERMIPGQAFPKRRSLFNQIPVIPGLGSGEGRFERATVPNAVRASKPLNQRPVYK